MRTLTVAAAAMLLAACTKDIQNSEAVRQGVLDYLKTRTAQTGLDMSMMQVDVASVSFQKDQARAVVVFRPKNAADAAPMQMAYLLDRKGNQWVVQGHGSSGENPHGAAGGEESPQLPPNHPPVRGGSAPGDQALPPGHPPMSPKQ